MDLSDKQWEEESRELEEWWAREVEEFEERWAGRPIGDEPPFLAIVNDWAERDEEFAQWLAAPLDLPYPSLRRRLIIQSNHLTPEHEIRAEARKYCAMYGDIAMVISRRQVGGQDEFTPIFNPIFRHLFTCHEPEASVTDPG